MTRCFIVYIYKDTVGVEASSLLALWVIKKAPGVDKGRQRAAKKSHTLGQSMNEMMVVFGRIFYRNFATLLTLRCGCCCCLG
jgi:hypothetical protein